MSWTVFLVLMASFFGGAKILIGVIEHRVRTRCTITRHDAAWLARALHDPNCPACSMPLSKHR